MGLLGRAATTLSEYLHLRNHHLRVPEHLRAFWLRKEPQFRAVTEQLEAGGRSDALLTVLKREPGIAPEGRMHWCEVWVYPSQDLLLYRDGAGPYAGLRREEIPSHLPMLYEGYLQVYLMADGQRLLVDMPLNPVPWCYPRAVWKKYLERLAKREGRRVRKTQEAWLAPYRQPLSHLGQRAWTVHVSEEIAAAELLANLVVVAEKEGFPIADDDRHVAMAWIQDVLQTRFSRKAQYASLVDDLVDDVYMALVQRFDLPTPYWSFRAFIRETARGLVKTALNADWKQRGVSVEPEFLVDSTSGERVGMAYPLAWVAQETGVSERTVRRWMADHGSIIAPSGTQALSEEQRVAFRETRGFKAIRSLLIKRGWSRKAAEKKVRRWQQEGLSFEEIAYRARETHPREKLQV